MEIFSKLDSGFPRDCDLLKEFVQIPSVSTDSAYTGQIHQAAEWVAQRCRQAGLHTEIRATPGHPAVVGHSPHIEGRPHLLIYGHYDVQPAEASDGWRYPPFQPTESEGYLYGRGASDNKGQILAHLCALRYLHESGEPFPVNLTILVEGEEEIGSPNLVAVLEQLKSERPPFSLALVSDTSTAVKGRPMIHYSLRGIVTSEVIIETAAREVHSGIFGGTTENAIRALIRILSSLHDREQKVTIPEFYSRVAEPLPWEYRELECLPFDEPQYLQWIGASVGVGEVGFSTNQRRWFRPTLEFNGVSGGYQGEGSKTIVPHRASVKLSARLVPDQDPEEVEDLLERWFLDQRLPGVRVTYVKGHSGPPYLLGRTSEEFGLLESAKAVLREAFGCEPLISRHGGAIPIVEPFHRVLGVKTLLMGLGFPDDGVHSFDERFSLEQFRKGIRMSVLALHNLFS